MVATLPLETVTLQVAVLPPSAVVTVMVASPTALPVTLPLESTVAMPVLEDFQVTFLLAALDGSTVAVSWVVPLTFTVALDLSSFTPVTATADAVTFTAQVEVYSLPSTVILAVMTASPAAFAVTLPLLSTDATESLLEDQVMGCFSGMVAAARVLVSPTVRFRVEGLTSTLPGVGAGVSSVTVISMDWETLLPSFAFTVTVAVPPFWAVTVRVLSLLLPPRVTASPLTDHVTDLSAASSGFTVTVMSAVLLFVRFRD